MGASLILAINVALGLAIMVSFLAFGLFDRRQKAAFWWFAACLTGVLSGLMEYTLPPSENTAPARFLIFSTFAVSLACLAAGLAQRYRGSIPWRTVGLGLVLAIGCYLAIAGMPRTTLLRNLGYQTAYTGLGLIGFYYVVRGMKPTTLDRAVAVIVGFYAVHFMLRPLLAHLLGGPGETAQRYLSTDYAMASQALFAVALILVAFILGIRTLTDILQAIRNDAEIDSLSGTLSRDAFFRRADEMYRAQKRHKRPLALLICDLDNFKDVNDTHGHQIGDKVIAAFGVMIMARRRANDLAGRVGGEEFCVVLDGCDGAAARLYAEHLRLAFSATVVDVGPLKETFTASFGVTEIAPAETFETGYARADAALYAAKRAGRDRVVRFDRPQTAEAEWTGGNKLAV